MPEARKNNLGEESTVSNDYFFWLLNKVDRRGGGNDTRDIVAILHETIFVPLVPHDENREIDGIELRERFAKEHGFRPHRQFLNEPCSVLEMLVALAERMEEILTSDDGPQQGARWFWELVENLDLKAFDQTRNKRILERFVRREYLPNGRGGIFPMKHPPSNQKVVEIWYQMMAYLSEKYP